MSIALVVEGATEDGHQREVGAIDRDVGERTRKSHNHPLGCKHIDAGKTALLIASLWLRLPAIGI